MAKSRKDVAEALAIYYSRKFKGIVWCFFDSRKRAYCIRGEGLPPAKELATMYPNGWTLLDHIKPSRAQEMAAKPTAVKVRIEDIWPRAKDMA